MELDIFITPGNHFHTFLEGLHFISQYMCSLNNYQLFLVKTHIFIKHKFYLLTHYQSTYNKKDRYCKLEYNKYSSKSSIACTVPDISLEYLVRIER